MTTTDAIMIAKWNRALKTAKDKRLCVAALDANGKNISNKTMGTYTKPKNAVRKPFMKRIEEEIKINGQVFTNVKFVAVHKESFKKRWIKEMNGNLKIKKMSTPSFQISR